MENKTYIFEGKTTNEAIENGLKELKVSKSKVEIKVLEQEDKRSFFSILTPRVVKVEMKIKENSNKEIAQDEISKGKEAVEEFLSNFINKLDKELEYKVGQDDNSITVEIDGKNAGYLIGYRGEVLNSLQVILSNIVNKNVNGKVKVLLNVGGYREKREKDLQILATKIAATVVKNNKKITLEPMTAFERKVIHTKLQENNKVKTYSVGEEPYRKIVVDLK